MLGGVAIFITALGKGLFFFNSSVTKVGGRKG